MISRLYFLSSFPVPPSKLSGKEDNKGEKHGRKKFGHKERRKRESDDKVMYISLSTEFKKYQLI